MGPCPFRHGNHVYTNFGRVDSNLLQWGHVLSDMVTRKDVAINHDIDQASMGPCPFRHGNLPLLPPGAYGASSFNGAMSFQTW